MSTICLVTASAAAATIDPGPRRKRLPANDTLRNLGVNLARFRDHRGLTQEGLAALVKVDPSAVIRWEVGRTEPRPVHRAALARALRVRADHSMDFLYVDPRVSVEKVLLK